MKQAQMYVYDTPENLNKIKDFYKTLPECPNKPFDINQWMSETRKKMDTELIPNIDYNPFCAKMPLYFNLAILLGFQEPYSNINLKLKDIKYDPHFNLETDRSSKCCCSHTIHNLFFIKSPFFPIPCGCDCIEKHTLISPKDLRSVRKYAEEKYHDDQLSVSRNRKNIVKTLNETFVKDALEKEQKFRIENKLCIQCGRKCNWEKCFNCAKKCPCGKIITKKWEKYDTCFGCARKCPCGKIITGKWDTCWTCSQKNPQTYS